MATPPTERRRHNCWSLLLAVTDQVGALMFESLCREFGPPELPANRSHGSRLQRRSQSATTLALNCAIPVEARLAPGVTLRHARVDLRTFRWTADGPRDPTDKRRYERCQAPALRGSWLGLALDISERAKTEKRAADQRGVRCGYAYRSP
jgi:hypothetical protein